METPPRVCFPQASDNVSCGAVLATQRVHPSMHPDTSTVWLCHSEAVSHFGEGPALFTPRLLLRPRHPEDAPVMRELWTERDPRVPPHRRIDADGRPSVDDIREQLRTEEGGDRGLLAVVERATGEVIGYCGLLESDCGGPGEPEIAFELLRRTHGRGYATEAARAVVEQAREHGHRRLWATVWDWNTASRRVLEKLGFVEVGEPTPVPGRGRNLLTCLPFEPSLPPPSERSPRVPATLTPTRRATSRGPGTEW